MRFLVMFAGSLTALVVVVGFLAWLLPTITRRMIGILLTRPMSDTLAELYVSMKSTPLMDFLYSSLRSQSGDVVIRPMGSAKPVHGFDDLALVPAQLARRPVLATEEVALDAILGAQCKKPLTFSMPLFISGMAYGLALNEASRIAIAEASSRAKIPINSGQGPFLAAERQKAYRYILQFGRWTWNRDPAILQQADMIEVQVGQGAMPGNAVLATPSDVGPEIKALMHLDPSQAPIIHADLFLKDPAHPTPLKEVVQYLRSVTDGIPIALKMGAGDHLEHDLAKALEAAVDVVVIDGTEGATGNAPITLSDHFGIPSLYALARARKYLQVHDATHRVDLVISGGFREPGDFLKAYALGARAVGLGTIAMFALAHKQITRTVPFLPPTDLVFYRAKPGVPLDIARAALGLANFLSSCRKEMEMAIRTMGHTSVWDLSPEDLCALDPEIARITGTHYAGEPLV